MWYVYVLYSLKDGKFYIGCTNDLRERIKNHNVGKVESTKDRRPLKLIYYEACLIEQDALKREKYLKTYRGKQFLSKRLKSYFTR